MSRFLAVLTTAALLLATVHLLLGPKPEPSRRARASVGVADTTRSTGEHRDFRHRMLESWPEQQAKAGYHGRFITARRESEHRLKGPYRSLRTRSVSELYGTISPELTAAYPVDTEIDGRSARREEVDSIWDREDPLFRRYRSIVSRIQPLPLRRLDELEPIPSIDPDTFSLEEGRRIRARPSERSSHLESVTLWFDPDSLRLTRSHSLYRFDNDASFRITADYQRVAGLDVAHHVKARGVFFQERRLRVFTSLIRSRVTYSHYRPISENRIVGSD